MAKVQDWLRSSAKSPSDKIMKERLKRDRARRPEGDSLEVSSYGRWR